jgi:hypothetical protein
VTDIPQAASEDLLARVIQAAGEQEERQTFNLIVQQLADPATEGRAAARLLRTAAMRLTAADLSDDEDVRRTTSPRR